MTEIIEKIEEIFEVKFNGPRGYGNLGDGFEVVTNKSIYRFVIDNQGQCCEQWGYLHSESFKEDLNQFIGSKLLKTEIVDKGLHHYAYNVSGGYVKDIDTMFVNFETDKGILQFVAYNYHNGYYGHDVSFMKIDKELNVESIIGVSKL